MSHSHGPGCGCSHGAAGLQGEEFGLQYSLYQKIDLENVQCLNEEHENSGKSVFKPWEDRKNRDKVSFFNKFQSWDVYRKFVLFPVCNFGR